MSFTSLLRQTCTIKRATVTPGSTGIPVVTYANLATNVACCRQDKSGKTVSGSTGLDTTFDSVLFLEIGTDIRPQQGSSQHPDQVVIDGVTYTVQAVFERSGRAHHLTCHLKGLRSPAAA